MNVQQVQHHNHYIRIYQDQLSQLTSQLQRSNYKICNLCLNLLTNHVSSPSGIYEFTTFLWAEILFRLRTVCHEFYIWQWTKAINYCLM